VTAVVDHHHADVSGGWLRAATFGAMDGLVTNIALIAGVGGGGVGHRALVLTGVAGLVAGAISMGLGEYTSVRTQNEQVAAELAKERHELAVNPIGVGAAAVLGAVIGDSTGYAIGRRLGLPLFDRLGRRFPNHFGPGHVLYAERLFERWGARAVFFGRFIALLRIFAGPLAGALKMHYPKFLLANVSGAVCWAGGTTALVYYAGMAAERWLTRFSWIALLVAIACGVTAAIVLRERTSRAIADLEAEHSDESDTSAA